ncbi:MAG: ABC transporter permease [Spirochaetaceae bacterium]|nr:ABC transporter permease [Spirochaetaceae bacterium]
MSEKPITIIKPQNNIFALDLGTLWKYRDLIRMFVKRDFVTFYKQTILGPLWFLIQPLFTSAMFMLIFGRLANISTDETPQMLFYMAGIINWTYFSECFTKTSNTFANNKGLFGKIYFPRLAVPLADVITNMIRYAIQFSLFLVFFFYFLAIGAPVSPSWLIVFTPIVVMYLALLSLGYGMWISALTAKYWDLRFALAFVVQLWMYATPVVYPLSLVPEKYRMLMILNPVAPAIEFFKIAWLGAGTLDPLHTGLSMLLALLILFGGIIIFNRTEKTFVDTI